MVQNSPQCEFNAPHRFTLRAKFLHIKVRVVLCNHPPNLIGAVIIKVKIVFKDYAFLGSDSTAAALAARAVWEAYPDKFFSWYDAMFQKQDSENGGWGNKADILALAKSLDLDSNKIDQLMTSKAAEYQKLIDADKAEGTSLGINGTPGTIVGKQLISGAQPYASFKAAIDSQLK